MTKIILSINAGSSSVKVSVYSLEDPAQGARLSKPQRLADIQISGLTAPPATLSYTRGENKSDDQQLRGVSGPEDAYQAILKTLIEDTGLPALTKPADVHFACHRIVHGGDYDRPVRINRDAYKHLEELSALAPLHNAGALAIVTAVQNGCPDAVNIAFFDSAFHSTIPDASKTYVIDQKIAKRNKLRKYGFHGLSYAFITKTCAEYLRKPMDETNIIALHLGSGCSITAIRNGQSLDTSMGLTPLAGLPGATRSGDVDPSLIFHFTNHAGDLAPNSTKDMHLTTAEQILNKESGWKAITGTTDFGKITSKAGEGDEACKLAFDILVDRLVGYIGSYYVKMGGKVDALVFAGGIGEKGADLRRAVIEKVAVLGFELDEKRNTKPGDAVVETISAQGKGHAVLVCQTDEQEEMATQCAGFVAKDLGS
jgi:acetate kinase